MKNRIFRTLKTMRTGLLAALVVGAAAFHLKWSFENHRAQSSVTPVNAAPPKSLRLLVDETCGACHANVHFRPPGEYSLMSGATARTGGVVAQARGISPVDISAGDPTTSLVVQKPLDGSVTPHGGIKIPLSHPTIQALIDWVDRGAPAAEMDRPAVTPLTYKNAGPGEHEIVYSRRSYRKAGFKTFRNSAPGGNIYRLRFRYDSGAKTNVILEDVNLTNLPPTDDAQNPTVSLDGTKVAFARKQPGQPWRIWEVNSDGSGGLRQITHGPGNNIQPFYLPYLPDGTPARSGEGGVGFLSDSANFRDEYNTGLTLSLFVSDKDGGHYRQIDFNPSHDLHPWLHSSGVLIFTRWEHNQHQGHNFMSLFQITASDYETAGTNLFGVFGEHRRNMGNSFHDPSEILDANYGKPFNLLMGELENPGFGNMIVRKSSRDAEGGSVGGPFFPRLQGDTGTHPVTSIVAVGDDVEMDRGMESMAVSSITYREPRSLLNGLFVVSVATLTASTATLNEFTQELEYHASYSSYTLQTFVFSGSPSAPTMAERTLLLEVPDMNVDEATPLVVKPQPPKIGKPIDAQSNTGVFTSGDITDRQSDGQPRNFSVDAVSAVRFVRALQLSQGRVDTGRENDQGIATQIVGEAPIAGDGSFSAAVPARVPLQFQLIDKEGRVLVSHKPWVQVAGGETMRCVGCHASHNKTGVVQTLEARQAPSSNVDTKRVVQFHFHRDIQPILNAKCVSCHDDASPHGASGRSRPLTLVGRFTPSNVTEAFEQLTGGSMMMDMTPLARTQNSRGSELMWWLTGLRLTSTPPTPYPANPPAAVDHSQILTKEELMKISHWIDTGTNFRVVGDGQTSSLRRLDHTMFTERIWPIMEARGCFACHGEGGAGQMAMDLSGGEDAESQEDLDESRMDALAFRINYTIPEASRLLRKPLGEQLGGLSHVGGQIWSGTDDPDYLAIYEWIANTNPALAPSPNGSDLINVNNFPNPFRDKTTFVYRLTGTLATKVEISIYSQNGKLIREFNGPADVGGTTMGWNRFDWDGTDKNGDTVANDVYFYVVRAEFGDGAKRKFRGKCVKVN